MSAAYANREVEAPLFAEVDAQFDQIKLLVTSTELGSLPHDQVERRLDTESRELMRRMLQAHLTVRARERVVEPVDGTDGALRPHARQSVRKLASIFGSVEVARVGHSGRGVKSLFPLDADLNLPLESFSLEVRRRAADFACHVSFDEATRFLRQTTGTRVAKRQVEELTIRAARDFEAFYKERRPTVPAAESSEILVLSIDMKGVVVRPEDLRAKAQAAAKKPPRLDKRRTVAERRNRKRMAAVAAVYTIAPWVRTAQQLVAGLRGIRDEESGLAPRPKPEGKRIWASVANESEAVVEQAFQEWLARDPERKKRCIVLIDGDRKQLCWIKRAAKRHRVHLTVILDIIHVIEYLWIGAHAFHGDGTKEAEQWVAERLLKVLTGQGRLGRRRHASLSQKPGAAAPPRQTRREVRQLSLEEHRAPPL